MAAKKNRTNQKVERTFIWRFMTPSGAHVFEQFQLLSIWEGDRVDDSLLSLVSGYVAAADKTLRSQLVSEGDMMETINKKYSLTRQQLKRMRESEALAGMWGTDGRFIVYHKPTVMAYMKEHFSAKKKGGKK